MSEFDKWNKYNLGYTGKQAFEAGQQSQKEKIDELKKKYDAMYNAFIVADDCRKEWYESYMSARKERDELQVRVDESLEYLNNLSWASELDVENVTSILKGNKDEI